AWSEPILTKEGEVLGTFALYYPEPRVPTPAELELIETAAHVVLIAIQSDRSQTALQRAFQEIKQSEEKLRQERRELQQLIDLLPQQVIVLDTNGSLLHANQVMLDYAGYTLEEMQSGGTSARIKRDLHPEDLERVRGERERGFSVGVPFEIEKRVRRKDG